MIESWSTLERTSEGSYEIFDVRRDRVQSPVTGDEHDFHILEMPDWINVIPVTPDGQVACVRQYRHGTEEVTLEIPGGIIDAGEHPGDAARREMREETGYQADRLIPLGDVAPNPALQTNCCHTYLALDVRPTGQQDLDGGEEIDVVLVDRARIPSLIARGRITHALVVVAFYLLDQYVQAHPEVFDREDDERAGR